MVTVDLLARWKQGAVHGTVEGDGQGCRMTLSGNRELDQEMGGYE
mgnify:CR=1 FL=1